MTASPAVVFSVEHGDNKVPDAYAELFTGQEAVLASHRGYDPGAGELAVRFSTRFHAPCQRADITRLLVDQNRSIHNPRALFSDYSRPLSRREKKRILETYYWPYRNAVRRQLEESLAENERVLHLAIHSFTPKLRGEVRNCDIGLMYDPGRAAERAFADGWQQALRRVAPGIRVRRNYPYRGVSDGIVPSFRRQFAEERYIGLQIEVNQAFPFGARERWKKLQKDLVESFAAVLEKT